MDLKASNGIFKYSHMQNYLVTGGCDGLALMGDVYTPGVIGYRSSCSKNGTLGCNQCSNGIGWHMISIPSEVAAYSVNFKTLNGKAIAPGDAGTLS